MAEKTVKWRSFRMGIVSVRTALIYTRLQSVPDIAFVRSGYVNVPGGNINDVGSGWNWSRMTSSTTTAYRLGFGPANVNSSGNDYRYYGLSLRCLCAQVEKIKIFQPNVLKITGVDVFSEVRKN